MFPFSERRSITPCGRTLFHPSCWNRELRLWSWPASAWLLRTSCPACDCQDAGGLFAERRVARTARAADPPPPATAALSKVKVGNFSLNTFTNASSASASPPAVHQLKTSTFPLPAVPALPVAVGGVVDLFLLNAAARGAVPTATPTCRSAIVSSP